jgi:hypothetical protein
VSQLRKFDKRGGYGDDTSMSSNKGDVCQRELVHPQTRPATDHLSMPFQEEHSNKDEERLVHLVKP